MPGQTDGADDARRGVTDLADPLSGEPHDAIQHGRVVRIVLAVLVPRGGVADAGGIAMREHRHQEECRSSHR